MNPGNAKAFRDLFAQIVNDAGELSRLEIKGRRATGADRDAVEAVLPELEWIQDFCKSDLVERCIDTIPDWDLTFIQQPILALQTALRQGKEIYVAGTDLPDALSKIKQAVHNFGIGPKSYIVAALSLADSRPLFDAIKKDREVIEATLKEIDSTRNRSSALLSDIQKIKEDMQPSLDSLLLETAALIKTLKDSASKSVASEYKTEFCTEATNHKDASKKALTMASVFGCLILSIPLSIFFVTRPTIDAALWKDMAVVYIPVLLTLFTGLGLSIRTYMAELHNASMNRQKMLAMGAFSAFVAASAGSEIRDLLLARLADAVFLVQPSGFSKSAVENVDTGIGALPIVKEFLSKK